MRIACGGDGVVGAAAAAADDRGDDAATTVGHMQNQDAELQEQWSRRDAEAEGAQMKMRQRLHMMMTMMRMMAHAPQLVALKWAEAVDVRAQGKGGGN
jgi:hypothetical protein